MRHDDVGDQKMNGPVKLFCDLHCLKSIGCADDIVPLVLEDFTDQLPDNVLILDHEDRFKIIGLLHRSGMVSGEINRSSDLGQINAESAALAEFAFDRNCAAGLPDNSINGRQSETRSFARPFGGEERFENM